MNLLRLAAVPCFVVAAFSPLAAESVPVQLSCGMEARPGHNAMFAVDGDEGTWFATQRGVKAGECFTVIFNEPMRVEKLSVLTGYADGRERLAEGAIEVSEDGAAFTEAANLTDGAVSVAGPGRVLKAVRLRVLADAGALVLREFRAGDAPLAPAGVVRAAREVGGTTVMFRGDASQFSGEEQKQLTAFLEQCATLCGDKIGEMAKRLDSPWEDVPKTIVVVYKTDPRGVPGYALGNCLTLNTQWVLHNREESVGMFIHELSHVVQRYPGGNPGWLVEGLADLIRYELSPADDVWVRRTDAIDPKHSDYRHAYGEAAKFLAWIQKTHAPGLEGKLSRAMHDGKYRDELWTEIAGKDLAALWSEYRGE